MSTTFDIEDPMPFLEKSNWVVIIVGVVTLLAYLALVVPQMLSEPINQVSWVEPMIVAIVVFVVANILGNVVVAATDPKEAEKHDERDQDIDRFGERVGNWLIAAGAIAALILAMARADHFWIANAIFLAGMAGALLSSAMKIAAYHGPFQRW